MCPRSLLPVLPGFQCGEVPCLEINPSVLITVFLSAVPALGAALPLALPCAGCGEPIRLGAG